MKDNFNRFIDKMAKASGQYALCEAIKQGYKVLCESYEDRVFDNGDIIDVEDMYWAHPSWYDVYIDGALAYRHESDSSVDALLMGMDNEWGVQVVESGTTPSPIDPIDEAIHFVSRKYSTDLTRSPDGKSLIADNETYVHKTPNYDGIAWDLGNHGFSHHTQSNNVNGVQHIFTFES